MNHVESSGPTNADAILSDNEDFYMDHPGSSAPSNDDNPLFHDFPGSPMMIEEDLDEAYSQSKLYGSGWIAPHIEHSIHKSVKISVTLMKVFIYELISCSWTILPYP